MSLNYDIDKAIKIMEKDKASNITSISTFNKTENKMNSATDTALASSGIPADRDLSDIEKEDTKNESKDCCKDKSGDNEKSEFFGDIGKIKSKLSKKDNEVKHFELVDEQHKSTHSDTETSHFLNKESFASKRMSENKDNDASIGIGSHKKHKTDEYEKEDDKENDDSISTLSSIAKINENISKTRVDGLQTLYSICFGIQGKNNVVKKNLRGFSGFRFKCDSNEFKQKLDFIKKTEAKLLRGICDILSLDRKGAKEDIADRVLRFLIEPNESVLIEMTEEQDEEESDEEKEKGLEVKEENEEGQSGNEKRRKRKRLNIQPQVRGFSGKNSSSRPKRATAGKKMSAYVDFSSSEESVQKAAVSKRRRRNDDSESGSDYNPSGANSDSEAGREERQMTRGGRGRQPRKGRRANSDSDEDEPYLSDADSDISRRRRSIPSLKGRCRLPNVRTNIARARRAAPVSKEQHYSQSEEISEEEESGISEEDLQSKMKKKAVGSSLPMNDRKNNTNKAPVKTRKFKKHEKKNSDEDVEEEIYKSENESLNQESGPTYPTDEEIKNFVKIILDKANLEEITMKTVCKKVYARYPDFDLTEKKDFIKATVKGLIAA